MQASTARTEIACKNTAEAEGAISSYSSDIGITTNTTSDFSSTCVVLALVAGRQDFQP